MVMPKLASKCEANAYRSSRDAGELSEQHAVIFCECGRDIFEWGLVSF